MQGGSYSVSFHVSGMICTDLEWERVQFAGAANFVSQYLPAWWHWRVKNGLSDWVRLKKECSRCEPIQAIVWNWRERKGFPRCCHGFLHIGFKIICLWPKKLSPVWHEDSCCSNVRREDFQWGSGQDFSTFWESLVLVKTHKLSCPGVKLQYIHWRSARDPPSPSCQCAFTLPWRYLFVSDCSWGDEEGEKGAGISAACSLGGKLLWRNAISTHQVILSQADWTLGPPSTFPSIPLPAALWKSSWKPSFLQLSSAAPTGQPRWEGFSTSRATVVWKAA